MAPNKKYSRGKLTKDLELLLNQVCENIVQHFRLITGNRSICAAIRLAVYEKEKESIVYKTYARSNGLNSLRKKTSEAIPINQGIPRFLREEKSAIGVLFYCDLAKAAELGTYQQTKKDLDYPDEIKTMMVAPLNAWSGKKEDMIGILYITSRDNGVFKVKHTDSMAFVADLTAAAIANSIELVRLKCSNQDITGGNEYV